MGKKIVIVGGVAGGASVATRARRLDESAQITIYEQGPDVGFSNCALPYYLSRTVQSASKLVMMTPEKFKAQYNIDAVVNHRVVAIDAQAQTVQVQNVQTGDLTTDHYDELFLSPGTRANRPQSIAGVDGQQVFTLRNVTDVVALDTYLRQHQATHVAVIGGGFIGIETAENLTRAGYRVTLIEQNEQVLTTLDDDLVQLVHKQLHDHHVKVHLDAKVTGITKSGVTLADGTTVPATAVVMAAGGTPNTDLAQAADLHLGLTGGFQVDHNYQTNQPHIYAVGDAIEVTDALTRQATLMGLAWPAQMAARRAVDHVYGRPTRHSGLYGAQCLPVFDLNVATVGYPATVCAANHWPVKSALVIPDDKVGLMPDAHPLYLKVVFSDPSGEILGAQAIGRGDVDKQIDIIATLMQTHGTVEDLGDLELCYQPEFSTTKNAVNFAGLVATNLLNNEYRQVAVSAVRPLVTHQADIIDVREPDEYQRGHIVTARNIPMSQFRERLTEISRDHPVYLHCATGKRSYNVTRALQNLGYTNVVNVAGSFNALCEYEYFRDMTTDREPIVTAYHFDL